MSLFNPELTVNIILIDSTRYIMVYIDTDEDDLQLLYPEICFQVRETVFNALYRVFNIMELTEIEISPAVLCPCKKFSETHYALYFKKPFLRCSKTNARVTRAREEHMMWLSSGKKFRVQPSLSTLIKLSIPEQVGTKFEMFGTLLLHDATGVQVDILEVETRGNPVKINKRILKYWLQGKGLPVSWETLLDTLRACSLNELADQLQSSIGVLTPS